MVSSISYKLAQNKLITGFGARRCATRGRGGIRSVVGNVLARPALTFIANKVADLISGSGRKTYRKRTVRGSSWRVTGTGTRRPRRRLTIRRKTGTGIKRRAPRKTLLKRVHRRIMF